MNVELAGHLLWSVRDARSGAALCRSRILETTDAAPAWKGLPSVQDRTLEHVWKSKHDLSYYTWEAVRIMKLAGKVVKAGMKYHAAVSLALARLEEAAPKLKDLRDALTHPEVRRDADRSVPRGGGV